MNVKVHEREYSNNCELQKGSVSTKHYVILKQTNVLFVSKYLCEEKSLSMFSDRFDFGDNINTY